MPTVTLSFDHEINTSVQVGDKAYYVHTFPVGTANVWAQTTTPHDSADREDIREIGVIEIKAPEIYMLGKIYGTDGWGGYEYPIVIKHCDFISNWSTQPDIVKSMKIGWSCKW